MSVKILNNCPHCYASISEQNRLVTESCGHAKCRQCFLLESQQCSQCVAKNQSNFKRRLSAQNNYENSTTSHIKKLQLDTGQQQFECTICCKRFKSRSQIYYHKSCANGGQKKYKCTQCEKSFASKSHLRYHAAIHENKTHECDSCGKVFSKLILLIKHNKLHQTASQSCQECGKLYRDAPSLEAHKAQVHDALAEMTFKCHICDKSYFKKSTLRQHMLKHFAKRFVCETCDKKFHRNSTLQRHKLRHKERTASYECDICVRNFSDIATLARHKKIHEGSLQYKCRHCQIKTVRKDNMLRHVRNIHIGQQFKDCVEEINNTTNTKSTNPAVISNTLNEINVINEDEPKTVANSSVIKCVGNVEPVKIPNTVDVTAKEGNQLEVEIHSSGTHKKFKKKYDPIEMYRKILISDDDETKEINALPTVPAIEIQKHVTEIQQTQTTVTTTTNPSNISRLTHWRKNFKYIYEYKD